MNKVYLLIGGNLGDRYSLLEQAKQEIGSRIGELIKESSVYETAPWGFIADQNFLNQVIIIKTNFSSRDVLNTCLDIENYLGRKRSSNGYHSRTMDIDILFYNNEIIELDGLTIPHARLHQRRFTLEPLVEISSDYIHPKLKKTVVDLLNNCEDNSQVIKL